MRENFSREEMKSFGDYCRNGLTNIQYSVDNLDKHIEDWELRQNEWCGRIIEDGFGGRWSARCPECKKETMQIVRPGKVQCQTCY